jgi:hypothetical protein
MAKHSAEFGVGRRSGRALASRRFRVGLVPPGEPKHKLVGRLGVGGFG